MGGAGSGRHCGFGRTTVEDGLTLDINKLVRDGNIRLAGWFSGSLCWKRVSSGKEIGNIGYEANLLDPFIAWMRLSYCVNGEPQDQRITLEATRPNYGGRRWWFHCPATGDRVAKLHLPPGGAGTPFNRDGAEAVLEAAGRPRTRLISPIILRIVPPAGQFAK
jgi:hypothetical protein